MINVTLYFREGCWLCDKAEEMVNGLKVKYGINLSKISIDSDKDIYELYRYDIPVLEFKDGSALHGVIKKKDLIQKIEANLE
ncbi:MAG: glutaredoxin family protein [Nitrospirae bacterium]|nr:glutaredoxin family protein [Nitrospirota bacterium]